MNKLLLLLLLTTSNVYATELIAKFPVGTVVVKDTMCNLPELIDEFPYAGYTIDTKGKIKEGCWIRDNGASSSMITFIEKFNKDRYEYNHIESKYFK